MRCLPRVTDLALSGREFMAIRARVCAELHGEVLEVGFGSGRNVPHYPSTITRVRAVDPATAGRVLAARRVEASPVPVEYVGLDAGFSLSRLDTYFASGPKAFGYFFEGAATKT